MKFPIPFIVLLFIAPVSFAQKFELKLNASANMTLLPDFPNRVTMVDGFVVPNLIRVTNAVRVPVVAETISEVKPGAGFNIEAEAGLKLNQHWKLSTAAGVMQLRFDYDTYIAQSFYKNNFYLSSLSDEHGDTKVTYLAVRPLSVSYTIQRFSLQAGPVFNFLLSKEYSDVVVLYDKSNGMPAGGFFEEKNAPGPLLWGAHLNARYAVIKPLEIMLGGQYFFNHLYEEEGTYKPLRDKSKGFQLQLGVSYNIASLFQR